MSNYKLMASLIISVFLTVNGAFCKDSLLAQAPSSSKYPEVMTGFDTKISVQILRCMRTHVPGFGHNGVVVLQYRLRKKGPNPPGNPPFDKDKWRTSHIKARDPILAQAFEPWEPNEGNKTYSDALWTDEWKPGQTGDGYVWLNIPERVKTIDVIFPYTTPQRVTIEALK